MNCIQALVPTICIGQAAKVYFLVGGAKRRRYALPHSSIMLHQPSGGFEGQASDVAIHANEILRVREHLNMIHQEHLTKPHTLDEIEKIIERD
ncbi:hypothetical protein L211DRAFT_838264 [Terfezia boudieri ATCC MYA-4762]|uniref:Endopeptidase Clp n=1 Tax=Terfezia boudieri ATCC MYA-4762 TaxID=1051890 RepID=A0A3N4LLL9_9PEZI|nr:hypothetical protein L211DRAFT_838264 [Terfezia boudieri ATCC MYA-4762]